MRGTIRTAWIWCFREERLAVARKYAIIFGTRELSGGAEAAFE